LQVPGRPRLYRTTQTFLRSFHISSLEELPPLPGLEDGGQLRAAGEETEAAGKEEPQ
jgi:segregation and condensation protein B